MLRDESRMGSRGLCNERVYFASRQNGRFEWNNIRIYSMYKFPVFRISNFSLMTELVSGARFARSFFLSRFAVQKLCNSQCHRLEDGGGGGHYTTYRINN